MVWHVIQAHAAFCSCPITRDLLAEKSMWVGRVSKGGLHAAAVVRSKVLGTGRRAHKDSPQVVYYLFGQKRVKYTYIQLIKEKKKIRMDFITLGLSKNNKLLPGAWTYLEFLVKPVTFYHIYKKKWLITYPANIFVWEITWPSPHGSWSQFSFSDYNVLHCTKCIYAAPEYQQHAIEWPRWWWYKQTFGFDEFYVFNKKNQCDPVYTQCQNDKT